MSEVESRGGHALRGDLQLWLAGPATLEDGWVVLDLARAREYRPLGVVGQHSDLAAVASPPDVLAFVQQHGLLRHPPGADEQRERLSDFESEALKLRSVLRLNLELRRALTDDPSERAEGLSALRGEPVLSAFFEKAPSDLALAAQASKVISTVVSDGLRGVELAVAPMFEWTESDPQPFGDVGDFMLAPHVPNLLGLAYYRLAADIVNRTPMRMCEECGRMFPVHDQRQRFCTKTCASRARYHRWSKQRSLAEEN